MEDLHRERILNNINLLAEKTQWNCVLEEKLLSYRIFNTKMLEDMKKVSLYPDMKPAHGGTGKAY